MARSTTSAAVAGALAALVGGLLWVLAWIVAGLPVWWIGAGLLLVAVVAAGAGLADRAAAPLRLVVGLCAAVLAWTLLAVVGGVSGVSEADGAPRVDGLVGVAAALVGAVATGRQLRRRRSARPEGPTAPRSAPGRRRTGGAHAA